MFGIENKIEDKEDGRRMIILFDSECLLCSRSVHFIMQRDLREIFSFASISSDIGQKLLEIYQIPKEIDSIILIDNNHYYIKSTAVLHICRHLQGVTLLSIFSIIPVRLRDFLYDIVAKNRLKWFGESTTCTLNRNRFL